ncbi:pyrroline-5-carboxylate reductase [Thiomicrospira sp. S5]|jgi:pyrroline-5-carboxylate reductase|uniref:pyrroline-5-carboxylate reductase n=1 Tax=Thiomicrospira sp. S5 TaxID=1803865 RepID=UPI0004A763E0|nr:pyrroline-5-carboxylate reductase [Thiomicrospira sp. S5]AZR81352.1 pyrroline-5-carboxylate reductase [Thiomicrospira sp. S5]AZR81521.1 pyrroline-5-carboxylate reductase [Thiomicrospira sp. S5]
MDSTICFIGAGNMSLSLMGGLLASGYPKDKILATDPSADRRQEVTQSLGIPCLESNTETAAQADIILLAVKPQQLEPVCKELADTVKAKGALVISIAAGVRTSDIAFWLGGEAAIVRTMPNTPALIRSGATGLFATASVSDAQKDQAENILRAAGLTVWVPQESDLDIVTAISGSGPAYYFLFMEAMQAAGQKLGLDESTARLLTIQTAFGAAKMALESPDDCATLRQKVTSPNGTTEKAIQTFEQHDLRAIIEEAMTAAKDRAISLADELGTTHNNS